MIAFLAGLLLGFVGSGHCAAMCGPLVLAAGPRLDRAQLASSLPRLLLYHGGRITTYLVLAVPAGLAGELLSLSGLERVGAVAGSLLLVASAFGKGQVLVPARIARFWSTTAARSCSLALPFSHRRRCVGAFAVGMANGLLPCGLVYAAMAASAATGSMIAASATMIGFGLGTVPALVVVSAAAASLAVSIRRRLARLAPLVLVVAAILILARAFDWPKGERQHIHPAAHFDPMDR
jgi:sulfite exporter TauE/SafE